MNTKNKRTQYIRKIVLDVLSEIHGASKGISKIDVACTKRGIDVNDIKLQRMKFSEKQTIDFELRKSRTKWELIKALQEEFDKLPDDTVFTSFSAKGIGKGRSVYF